MLIQRDIRGNDISLVNHGNKIQNSYNLLTILLAADGGWSPVANFSLVSKTLLAYLLLDILCTVLYSMGIML